MFVEIVFVLTVAVLCGSSQSFVLNENSNKLSDLDWQCDTICLGSGGRASFDPKNKICKCTTDKNTDEIDILRMQKNAKDIGLQIITCNNYKELEKRDINEKRNIDEKQSTKVEERVGAETPKFPILEKPNEKLKPISRNAVPSPEKPKKFHPFARNFDTSLINNRGSKSTIDLKARLHELQNIHKKKLNDMIDQGLFPHIKERNNFKIEPRKVEDPKDEKPDFQQALALVKQKQNELVEKFKSRHSELLGRSRMQTTGKRSNESDSKISTLNALSQTKPIDRNAGELKTHLHRSALASKKGIIVQPLNSYVD